MGEGEHDAPFKHYHICLLNKLLLYYYCLNPKYLWIHDYKIFKAENYEVPQQLHVGIYLLRWWYLFFIVTLYG